MTIPEDFTQANQDSYDDLIVSIEASVNKLSLLLGVCDDAQLRDKIIAQYEQELAPEFRFYRLGLDKEEPSITKVISELIAQEPYLQNQGKAVFTITGTEGLSFLPGNSEYDQGSPQKKFFGYLQWTREALRTIPYPIVLWMRQQMIGKISHAAPDFWSWRKGVFHFWCHQTAALSSENVHYNAAYNVAYIFEDHRDWLKIEEDKDDFLPVEDLQELVAQIEQRKGTKDRILATLYARLGRIYYDRAEEGKYQAYQQEQALAVEYLTKAIAIQTEHKMEEDLAASLNNLALLYRSQGRYEEAEPLYKKSIEIDKIALSPNHPELATHLNNLANLYRDQGRYEEAEPLYLQAIEIDKIVLLPNHPSLATDLNNLALLYESQGRYEQAESLYLQAIEIVKIALPPNHPELATHLNNLAALYKSQGRDEEAEPLFLQAIEIDKIALPPNHPELANHLNNLALLYESQGRYEQAEPLFLQAIEIVKIALPPNHPELATHLNNLAALYRSQGRYEEAEPLYLQALRIFVNSVGKSHPNTQTGWNNFYGFIKKVVKEGREKELSSHPMVQGLIGEIKNE